MTPYCYRKIIDCQASLLTTDHFGPTANPTTNISAATPVTQQVGTTNVSTTTTEIQVGTTNVLAATTVTQQAGTTLLVAATTDGHTTDGLVTMGYVHSTDFDNNGDDDGPTFNPLNEKWTWADDDSTTKKDFKTVDDLQITAEIVYYDTSSEFTAVEPNVSSTIYKTTDSPTMDSTTGSIDELAKNSGTESIGSLITESITSSMTEPMTSLTTESISSLDTKFISNTTTQSVSTTKNESYDAINNDQQTDEISSSKTRMKRIPEIIYNGTHCFRVVCSPPSPASVVTKAPNSSQGFSEDSSKY